MKRSYFIYLSVLGGLATACGASGKKRAAGQQTAKNEAAQDALGPLKKLDKVKARVLNDPVDADTISVGYVEKTADEWKAVLTDSEYHILRERGTEPAFENEYYDNKTEGIYYCAACGLPIYSSKTKFHSGTGWPSFWAPIDTKLVARDRYALRNETC